MRRRTSTSKVVSHSSSVGRTKALTDDLQKALDEAIDEFRQTFLA